MGRCLGTTPSDLGLAPKTPRQMMSLSESMQIVDVLELLLDRIKNHGEEVMEV